MNPSIYRADAATHVKVIATALVAASVVVWIGIAAHVASAPPTIFITMPGQPATVAMIERHRF
jgi:hypothetical protein